jgi:two-component system, NarL family, sensor histidine kinase UhpB
VRRLLRVPLFYKILIANAAIVLVGTVVGTVLTRAYLREGADLTFSWIILLAAAGMLVTILVNAIILRVALSPLKLLERTAEQVQAGDLDARVPYSPLRDVQLERLTRTFNGMLDNLESYRQRLSGVAARALDAEEQERKRIARELHDDTSQSLAALLIRLRLLRNNSDPRIRDAALDEFREELGEALERIRRFARGLRPPALDELGLVPAVESHVRALSESLGILIRIEAEPIEDLLTRQAELALYRIAQEAISNAVRHADPNRVMVAIARTSGAVALTVSDDGTGFALDEISRSGEGGLGLFGMKERASYVGGTVTIRSAPGAGTVVRAEIPVTPRRGAASAPQGAEMNAQP